MKIKQINFFILSFVLATFAVTAQAATWKDLELKVLDLNPDIRSARSLAESKNYEYRSNYSDYWPQLNLFAQETREDSSDPYGTYDALTNTIRIDTRNKYTTTDYYGLKSSWNLFRGFSTENNVTLGRVGYEIAVVQLDLKSIDLRYALKTAYINYAMAQKSMQTSQTIIDQQKRNRDLIKIKYDNGLEAAWALEQADVALQLAQLRLEQDKEDVKQAQETINRLVDDNVIQVDGQDESLNISALPPISSDLVDNNPQVRYQNLQKQQAVAEKKLAQSEYYPSLDASYSWITSQEKNDKAQAQNSVSLVLTWNIFDGFRTSNRTHAAAANELAADLAERSLKQQLRLDLDQQRRNFELQLREFALKKHELKTAILRSDTVSNQYRNGQRKYQDWETSEIRRIDLEREMVALEKQTLLQKAAWEKTAGYKLGDL